MARCYASRDQVIAALREHGDVQSAAKSLGSSVEGFRSRCRKERLSMPVASNPWRERSVTPARDRKQPEGVRLPTRRGLADLKACASLDDLKRRGDGAR